MGGEARAGALYYSPADHSGQAQVTPQMLQLSPPIFFYFRAPKDKKQTSLTVWPLNQTKLQFPKLPQNKSLIFKEVA